MTMHVDTVDRCTSVGSPTAEMLDAERLTNAPQVCKRKGEEECQIAIRRRPSSGMAKTAGSLSYALFETASSVSKTSVYETQQ
jgi:hypothetical protein